MFRVIIGICVHTGTSTETCVSEIVCRSELASHELTRIHNTFLYTITPVGKTDV